MAKTSKFDISRIISYALFILVGVFVLQKGAVYYLDSYAFLDMRFNRSPLYSTFLKLFTSVFGDAYKYPVVITQYAFIIVAISFLLNTLKSVFKLSFISLIVVQLIVLAPCIYWHLTANKILSEAIAYPLFLILFTFSFKFLIKQKFKYIYLAASVLCLLILTRGQFIALLPVLMLLTLFVLWQKRNVKKGLIAIVILLMASLIANVAERTYNKIVHGYFVSNAMSYVHLISADFYISKAEDVNLFNDQESQTYFNLVRQSLVDVQLTREQVLENELDDQEEFERNFSKICNVRVHELGLKYFASKGLNLVEQNLALNELCAQMYLPLFKKNFKERLKLFYKNLKTTFGSSKYMLLFLMLLIIGMIKMLKSANAIYKFIVLSILFMFANNTLIAAVVHPINRYTFYFDWIIFVIVLVLFVQFSKKT